jgi:hypothetical protein
MQRDEVNAWQASKGVAFVSVPMIVAAHHCKRLVLAAIDTCVDELLAMED